MALIQLGGLVSGLRGTVGGVTYSANASSNYAKAWAKGPRSQTALASLERSRLATWGPLWRAMSAAQRTAWDTYAALAAQAKTNSLGDTYYASGFNWYVEINDARTRAGLAVTSTTPANPAPAAPAYATFYLRAPATDTLDVYINKLFWTSGNYLAVYLWVDSRITLTYIPMAWYFWIDHDDQADSGAEWRFALTTPWRAKNITVTAGQRCYWLVYAMQPEGRMSAPAFFQSNVL